jgi:hypothetical protein
VIEWDYAYFSMDQGKISNSTVVIDRDKGVTVLMGYDKRTGYSLALPGEKKGTLAFALLATENFLRALG